MTLSVTDIASWLESKGMVEEGSQGSYDAAAELLWMMRTGRTDATMQDTRNIQDYLKGVSTEEIRERLEAERSGLVSVFSNVLGDFNIGSAVRNVNWFNGESAIIAGRKKMDKRGTVGAHHYIDFSHTASLTTLIDEYRAKGYRIIAAEINENAVSLVDYQWQYKTVAIYGEEGAGLSEEVLALVDDVVYIPGRGSVRSLNLATSHGIFTYDYNVKQGLI